MPQTLRQLMTQSDGANWVRTVVARYPTDSANPKELALEVSRLVDESVSDTSIESLSVLMPQVLDAEALASFVWELGNRPRWQIEREGLWRDTLALIGLRVVIANGVAAETLGMGPFGIFPTTRHCPITTLEVRTNPRRAKKSQLTRDLLASHLADIPTEHILTRKQHGALFRTFTPWLKRRILGYQEDMRAKAGVTYSLPVVIWNSLKG